MNSKINICIVDDHALFREGIHFLLSKCEFVKKIYEAEQGLQLLELLQSKEIDLILMDIEMPKMNGIETTKKVLQKYPDIKIIALSMYANECFYTDMLAAGAKGFMLKNSRFEDIQKAITEVFAGKNFFSPEILSSILKNMNKPTTVIHTSELSEREMEVLFNICKGLSNREIADKLFISKRTVDKHRENILLKTNSKNTAELVIYAIKKGYFDL